MTGRGWTKRPIAFAVLLATFAFGHLATPRLTLAARLDIQGELDRSEIGVGEVAVLTVTVTSEGLELPAVRRPVIPGLTVTSMGESQGFSWVNGRVSRTRTAAFALRPSAAGTFDIPAIRVRAENVTAETRPLRLRVGSAPRARAESKGDELFVRLDVDRTEGVWNEGVMARFTMYSRVRLEGAPAWDPPEAPGFWAEVLGPPRTARARLDGIDYDASELRVAYFPTRTGRLWIGPGRVHAQVLRRVEAPDPWSMLGVPEARVEEVTLETRRVPIAVRPLPPSPPAGFGGAVGSYALEVRVDRASVRAGEPVAVTTVIRGVGNLASAGDPEVASTAGARRYAGAASTAWDRSGERLRGERSRTVTFVPERVGTLAILPVRFAWFDPEAGRYRSQVSDTIRVQVLAPGRVGDSLIASRAPGPLAALRSSPGSRGSLTLEPPSGAVALGLASLLAYVGIVIARRANERRERDPRRSRVRALERILLEWRGADRAEGNAARAATLLRRATAIRYDVEVEGSPLPEALTKLRTAGAAEDEVRELGSLLTDLDRLAFAPPGAEERGAALRAVGERLRRYREDLQ